MGSNQLHSTLTIKCIKNITPFELLSFWKEIAETFSIIHCDFFCEIRLVHMTFFADLNTNKFE